MNEGVVTFFAPITLMIGGGLIAMGLLSFLDLNYFKTKLRARLALAVGLAFMFVTEALFLTSTGTGRYFTGLKTDVTDCEFEVERDFADERRTNKVLIHKKIVNCMDQLGYEWVEEHGHCLEARIATNVFCYLPKGRFDRSVVAFQMRFE